MSISVINIHSQSMWKVPPIIHKIIRNRLMMQLVFLQTYEQPLPTGSFLKRKHADARDQPTQQLCEDFSITTTEFSVRPYNISYQKEFLTQTYMLEEKELQTSSKRASVIGDYSENTPWKHFAYFVDRTMFYVHIVVMTVVMTYFLW